MTMDVEKLIREYLPQILHMSLATCVNDKPWVCEVHFVYDHDLNLYWRSKPSRRHSLEIKENPKVAGNIVTQHGVSDKPRAVYFEGSAMQLDNVDENHEVYKEFCARLGAGPEILEDAKQEDGHKFYMVKVSDYYLFDSRESTPSQKYHWKR